MHCWRTEASEPTGICLRCCSYKAIGRTVSCETVLAYFSRVCSASSTTSRGVSLAVRQSQSDARRLRRALLHGPSSSIHHQLSLVGFCKSLCSYVQNPRVRSSCFFLVRKVLEVSAILVRFVYLDTRRRTTVGLTYIITYIHMEKIFPSAHKGWLAFREVYI